MRQPDHENTIRSPLEAAPTFRLAEMDGFFRILTAVCAVVIAGGLLLLLLVVGGVTMQGSPKAPMALVVGALVVVFLALIFGSIWAVFRPSYFQLSARGLFIKWPLRSTWVPLEDILGSHIMTRAEFRAHYGTGYRIGAGGFLGMFGLFKTSTQTFRAYVSRMDHSVVLNCRNGRPLMITPEQPQLFVDTLQRLRLPLDSGGHAR